MGIRSLSRSLRQRLRSWAGGEPEPYLPYLRPEQVGPIGFRFFFATPEARDWYDPLKPYARLEYEWVLENIPLPGQKILDGGAHHGQYSIVFGLGADRDAEIVAVDPVDSNCDIAEVNFGLNALEIRIERCAISNTGEPVRFSGTSNGRIVDSGGILRPSKRLVDLLPDATIIKLDIEGAEFDILPHQLVELPSVHTWIVEIHPYFGRDPDLLTRLFLDRGFTLDWVDREKNQVVPYAPGIRWSSHSTVFARRS
jgi:FkbM family methyltransferase